MAIVPKFTKQFSCVGTPDQVDLITALEEAGAPSKVSVVRWALNKALGLTDDDRLPPGESMEQATERVLTLMKGSANGPSA